MINELHALLSKTTSSELHFDEISRAVYSIDASIYEVKPLGIAIPRNSEDLIKIVKIASQLAIPMTPRGAATGITGSCLGEGLIIDTSKYLCQILNLDLKKEEIRCEPGVIQDELNRFLAPYGYRLGPDTSTGNRATLGGMASNNAAGARSLLFGSMVDAIKEVELILSSGECIRLAPLGENEWNYKLSLPTREGDIYRALEKIRRENREEIETKYPPLPRRASGYLLDHLLSPFPINPAKLIAGSEGTLGIIRSLTLSIVPKLEKTELQLIGFEDLLTAMEAVPEILKKRPISLELIDDKILHAAESSPSLRGKIDWLKKIPKALLIAEFRQGSNEPLEKGHFVIRISSQETCNHVWEVRKAGLGLLLSKRSYSRALAFIEDVALPPDRLAGFLDKLLKYLKSHTKEAGIYGHAGPGCLHIRPYIDLRDPREVALMRKMMVDVADLVVEFGGSLSGEHGDGLIRSWLLERLFGKTIVQAFKLIKEAFDPLNLMNPHKIVDPFPVEKDLKKSPINRSPTFLSFEASGGLSLSVDLCNGNGACRKKTELMCPSFQVTRDEYDTTRARAETIRYLLNENRESPLADPGLNAVLDLCIQCKGCKTECPSQVDMAKMKSEALFQYQERHGYSLRNRLFAQLDFLSQSLFPFRSIHNYLIKTHLGKKIASWFQIVGPLPEFGCYRFSEWAKKVSQPKGKQVVLLIDTYTEFYCPGVGIAALQVINRLGYEAIIPPWKCCGRPAISKGFLKQAKQKAFDLSMQIKELPYENLEFITLEPSCRSTLFDEFPEFLPRTFSKGQWLSFDAFVLKNLPEDIKPIPKKVAIHGHCHQKALEGMDTTLQLLKKFPDLIAQEIPSGCCGMAGSFGHEKEHAEFSKKIGELVLLPYIRNLDVDTSIIANGFSCRSQIHHHTKRKALHLAEWLSSEWLN